MPQEISPSALFPPQRPPSVVGRLGREKRKRVRATSPRLPLFDYGYPLGASADERGELDNRGAEMIWNERRKLFKQVRIDLEARLIITLLFKCEGEISLCYRSNETSSLLSRTQWHRVNSKPVTRSPKDDTSLGTLSQVGHSLLLTAEERIHMMIKLILCPLWIVKAPCICCPRWRSSVDTGCILSLSREPKFKNAS